MSTQVSHSLLYYPTKRIKRPKSCQTVLYCSVSLSQASKDAKCGFDEGKRTNPFRLGKPAVQARPSWRPTYTLMDSYINFLYL